MNKILIVSDYLDQIWGIETYIKDLKKVLPNYKIEYFWVENISNFKRKIWVFTSIYNIKSAKLIEKKIKEFKPDIIWCHSISRFLGHKVLQKINKSKAIKIMTYHDLWYFSPFATKIYQEKDIPQSFSLKEFLQKTEKIYWPYIIFKFLKLKLIRKELQKFDVHTVPSEFMKKYVINHKYWNKENTHILPNFILKEKISPKEDIFQDKINFIFFWRLETEKWIWALIKFLSDIFNLQFKNKEKFKEITSKIRIFIFGEWSKKEKLIELFTGTDLTWKDISLIANFEKVPDSEILSCINKEDKIAYFFWKRSFETIKKFLSFSHYNIVPSLFLETFWLSAAEACANKVINIGYDKPNLNSFILEKYKIQSNKPLENFSKKMFEIIEKFDKTTHKEDSQKSFKLVEKFII